jgi:hypothetical protein
VTGDGLGEEERALEVHRHHRVEVILMHVEHVVAPGGGELLIRIDSPKAARVAAARRADLPERRCRPA